MQPEPPAQLAEKRRVRRQLHEALCAISPDGKVRLGWRQDGGKVKGGTDWEWCMSFDTPDHHLRAVLPSQIVFDIGDDRITDGVREPTPWPETVAAVHAVADALTMLGIPYWMSLSGGKGVHIEVFLSPTPPTAIDMAGACANCMHEHRDAQCAVEVGLDATRACGCRHHERGGDPVDRRVPIAHSILAVAAKVGVDLPETVWGIEVPHDPLLIAPRHGSRLVREFGERKGPTAPHRKVLWHIGPSPAPRLPLSREAAYIAAEHAISKAFMPLAPVSPPASEAASCLDRRWARATTNGPGCPQSSDCFLADAIDWGCCKTCPIYH